MVFYNIDAKSKDANKSRLEANMIRDRPGAIGFTSGFSQDSISITVGEQITVEQLIEKCKFIKLLIFDSISSILLRRRSELLVKAIRTNRHASKQK